MSTIVGRDRLEQVIEVPEHRPAILIVARDASMPPSQDQLDRLKKFMAECSPNQLYSTQASVDIYQLIQGRWEKV